MTHKVAWRVSLSNGETFTEGKGKFTEVEGELSPYQRLMNYITSKDLSITSLSLITPKGEVHNLPSSGNKPKFGRLDGALQPKSYAVFRAYGQDYGENAELYTVAEAHIANAVVQLWVSEANPMNSWVILLQGGFTNGK